VCRTLSLQRRRDSVRPDHDHDDYADEHHRHYDLERETDKVERLEDRIRELEGKVDSLERIAGQLSDQHI
jgi:predicted RNase H-like nuclease (RuvC/YqgF family)